MIEKKSNTVGVICAVMAYVIFGFSYIFTKDALVLTTPFVLIAVRFVFAFLIINVLVLFKAVKINLKGKKMLPVLALGLVQPVGYFICETLSVNMLPSSMVGIMLAICPVLTIIAGGYFLGEKVKSIQVMLAVVSVVGVGITTIGSEGTGYPIVGIVLAMLAVLSGVAFNILSRKTSGTFTAWERTYVMFAMGTATFTVLALATTVGQFNELVLTPMMNANFWVDIVYLGGISSCLAFYLLNTAMTHLPVGKVTIFTNLTSVISILAGVIFLKEAFGKFQIMGSVLVIVSVCLVMYLQSKNNEEMDRDINN